MALANPDSHRFGHGTASRHARRSHHGRVVLAEVVPIRSGSLSQDLADSGMMRRIARVFASLRAQAATRDISPRPPSPPAPRADRLTVDPFARAATPDDVA
jgi:hypothetical protein